MTEDQKENLAEAEVDSLPKKRTRTNRNFPKSTLEECLKVARAIQEHASGKKLRLTTLAEKLNSSPTSSNFTNLVSHCQRYSIVTKDGDFVYLTEDGKFLGVDPFDRRAAFNCGIASIPIFNKIYAEYKEKRLPTSEAFIDFVLENGESEKTAQECVDLFRKNAEYIGIIQFIKSVETLRDIDEILGDADKESIKVLTVNAHDYPSPANGNKKQICFYVSPIGQDDSQEREHSDCFMNHLIRPVIEQHNLTLVRADHIQNPGQISEQILEHLLEARLVIIDLSFHNPNVFYEMAIRHASALPCIHIIRKLDSIPFDLKDFKTITIDTNPYKLLSRVESYKTDLSTYVRSALESYEPSAFIKSLSGMLKSRRSSIPEF